MEQERDFNGRLMDLLNDIDVHKDGLNGFAELIADARNDTIPNSIAYGICGTVKLWADKIDRTVKDFIKTEKKIHGIS